MIPASIRTTVKRATKKPFNGLAQLGSSWINRSLRARPQALLIIWTHPAWHPTVRFTSQVLSEHDMSIDILFSAVSSLEFVGDVDYGAGVTLHRVVTFAPGLRQKLSYVWFITRAWLLGVCTQPDYIIGYDLHGGIAAYAARAGSRKVRFLYHNLDLSPTDTTDLLSKLLTTLERTVVRHSDRVIVSSAGRGQVLQQRTGLPEPPIVVKNCQRLGITEEPTGELARLLQAKGIEADRLVIRLGNLGPGHGIEATIESITNWHGNWILVLVGTCTDEYLGELRDLANSLNVRTRVIFIPSASYHLWYDCLYAAHVGISLYEPGNINHASMAGAGNKLNLYLKAGIPSIVSNQPDFEEFVSEYGAAEIADPYSPASIARAVNNVFDEPRKYKEYCTQATSAFELEYNFERQFSPVLKYMFAHRRTP